MVVCGDEDGAFDLRTPDGHVVFMQRGASFGTAQDITWSPDGGRVAIAGYERLLVLDAATGGVLLRSDRPARVTDQAFAADGSWLAVSSGDRVLRVDIPSGRATRLYGVRGSAASMPTADRVRLDYAKVEKRFREAGRGTARQALATELDRWLRAAGFEPTEGSIEIVC